MSKFTPPPLQADAQPVHDVNDGGLMRDLALCYQRAGDVLLARGYFAKASEKYQACVNLFDRLAANDPGNRRIQRDLANARARIADVPVVGASAQVGRISRAAIVGWLQRAIEYCVPPGLCCNETVLGHLLKNRSFDFHVES